MFGIYWMFAVNLAPTLGSILVPFMPRALESTFLGVLAALWAVYMVAIERAFPVAPQAPAGRPST